MIFGKTKKVLEEKQKAFMLNLENNYKDAAFTCWKEYEACIMDLKREGKINDKEYEKLITEVNKYKSVFASFH